VASTGKPPPAISGLAQQQRLTIVAVRPRLAGCLCTGTIMDYIVHRIVGDDQAAGTAGMTLVERPGHFNATSRADHCMSGD
jgi:hypothetical protein